LHIDQAIFTVLARAVCTFRVVPVTFGDEHSLLVVYPVICSTSATLRHLVLTFP
jgi:hypothetical protein